LTVTLVFEPAGNPTVISEEATPLGATAAGVNDAAESVNSEVPCCASAGEVQAAAKNKKTTHKQAAPSPLSPADDFTMD
jgi:hypothetical protein